jgi:hypothetical protein
MMLLASDLEDESSTLLADSRTDAADAQDSALYTEEIKGSASLNAHGQNDRLPDMHSVFRRLRTGKAHCDDQQL